MRWGGLSHERIGFSVTCVLPPFCTPEATTQVDESLFDMVFGVL